MPVQALRLHQVEIAAADLACGNSAGKFEDRIVGMDNQRHLAPLCDVLHRGSEFTAGANPKHFRR
jgi:hypothetical protein